MSRKVAFLLAAVSVGALAGCSGVVGARMTFEDTETEKITEIVLAGGRGDVMVTTDGAATKTTIQRIVNGGSDPGSSYQRAGSVLTLGTECGPDCSLSYQVVTPAAVTVRGELTSGDVTLSRVGSVDLRLTSGDVMVEDATGPVKVRTTNGDMNVTGGTEVAVEARNGDISVLGADGPVTAQTTSGDIDLKLGAVASVTATATDGDIDLMVPPGSYRLRADTHGREDGKEIIGITDDPSSPNVLTLRSAGGELRVIAG
ncbi:liaG [Actinoplanes utahensis]|uniref:LiaG n=2 Tax=Actinoplanes utahensis TaxID=1869 RepID=A0A0A6UJ10_ACTUT|nr:liaG [Actinoplanes utahensis]